MILHEFHDNFKCCFNHDISEVFHELCWRIYHKNVKENSISILLWIIIFEHVSLYKINLLEKYA